MNPHLPSSLYSKTKRSHKLQPSPQKPLSFAYNFCQGPLFASNFFPLVHSLNSYSQLFSCCGRTSARPKNRPCAPAQIWLVWQVSHVCCPSQDWSGWCDNPWLWAWVFSLQRQGLDVIMVWVMDCDCGWCLVVLRGGRFWYYVTYWRLATEDVVEVCKCS